MLSDATPRRIQIQAAAVYCFTTNFESVGGILLFDGGFVILESCVYLKVLEPKFLKGKITGVRTCY